MNRKGNPLDNSVAESFIKTLKYEEDYLWEYETYDEAHRKIIRSDYSMYRCALDSLLVF